MAVKQNSDGSLALAAGQPQFVCDREGCDVDARFWLWVEGMKARGTWSACADHVTEMGTRLTVMVQPFNGKIIVECFK